MRRTSKALPRSFPVRLRPRISGSLLSHRCAAGATGGLPACRFRIRQGLVETGSLGYTMAARRARAGVADDGAGPEAQPRGRVAASNRYVAVRRGRRPDALPVASRRRGHGRWGGRPCEFCSRGRRAAGAFEARASAEGPRRSLSEHRMPDPAGRLRSV